jgi:hypothetical protein
MFSVQQVRPAGHTTKNAGGGGLRRWWETTGGAHVAPPHESSAYLFAIARVAVPP